MIIEQFAQASLPTYQVCIIGSGPAGLTVARELHGARKEISLCVLESGKRAPSAFAAGLREVESEGIKIRLASRERIFGGSSTTWAGTSSPLDPIDLRKRPWVRDSGWPVTWNDLLPFYGAAAERFAFPEPNLFETGRWESVKARDRFQHRWSDLDEKVFSTTERPVNFAREFGEIFENEGIDLLLDATVLRLEGEATSGAVTRALVRCSSGAEMRIHAHLFVLAAGGIENARLLLLSRFACRRGLGNEHDQVGRYLMNHPKETLGTIQLRRPLRRWSAYLGYSCEGFSGYLALRLRDSVQEEHGLLNAHLRLQPALESGWWRGASGLRRKASRLHSVATRNFLEMEPEAENRVMLSVRRDALGQPLARVRHRVSALGRRTLEVLHRTLEAEIARAGWGRFITGVHKNLEPWPIIVDASHHMGATRMGVDALTSVVNRDCRLHSCPNVYLAGASVFPTSGSANPTYTIVALAIRLAAHLCDQLTSAMR